MDEQIGEYSLCFAASNLHTDIISLLIEFSANLQLKSSKLPSPLLAAIQACAVLLLEKSQAEKVKECLVTTDQPIRHHFKNWREHPVSVRQVYECEKIVRLLLENGANVKGGITKFEEPYIWCAL
ncbi:hypothetical protein F5Y06DRAFT_29150 [Hypoxylon sp. FL0890]|nr:hypothetical protein F5Y06DRAFT_29150 [Hypoxylon sp. FL0890]